jgi:hypothetical protein
MLTRVRVAGCLEVFAVFFVTIGHSHQALLFFFLANGDLAGYVLAVYGAFLVDCDWPACSGICAYFASQGGSG